MRDVSLCLLISELSDAALVLKCGTINSSNTFNDAYNIRPLFSLKSITIEKFKYVSFTTWVEGI